MRTSDMVKSKFWRATDVQGKPPIRLTIADVTEELLGRGGKQDVKCFLWFTDSPKGLQLNRTRVALLEAAFGPDSEGWVGKRVRLSFDPTVIFGGRAVGGVKLETPPGVVWNPHAELQPGWGAAPQGAQNVPGRPPPPIWDEQRQVWITPQPIARPGASPSRPPPPVWNEATQTWETVDLSTGEVMPQATHQRPATISERVNAGHPPGGTPAEGDWGPLPPQSDEDPEFGHADIPF